MMGNTNTSLALVGLTVWSVALVGLVLGAVALEVKRRRTAVTKMCSEVGRHL